MWPFKKNAPWSPAPGTPAAEMRKLSEDSVEAVKAARAKVCKEELDAALNRIRREAEAARRVVDIRVFPSTAPYVSKELRGMGYRVAPVAYSSSRFIVRW